MVTGAITLNGAPVTPLAVSAIAPEPASATAPLPSEMAPPAQERQLCPSPVTQGSAAIPLLPAVCQVSTSVSRSEQI